MARLSLTILLALAAWCVAPGPVRPSAASLAWLSFPAGEAEFQQAIHDLIKDYGKDLVA